MAARLGEQQNRDRVDRALSRADRLVRVGQRSQAIAELRVELDRAPAGAGRLREQLTQLERAAAFDAAMSRGAAAESTGRLDDAVTAYREAAALRQDETLERKLADLESTQLLRKGLSLIDEGKAAEAEDAITRSLGIKDTPEARAALGRIESASQQQSFVRAGNRAYEAGQFHVAAAQYRNALELGAVPELELKLRDAQIMDLLVRALDAMESGNVPDAERLIVEARRVDPDDPRIAAAVVQFDAQREYLRYRDAGNAAREKNKFGDAKWNYERARRVAETSEIKRLLSETEYDHLVAQARSYMAVGEYVSARALLRTAADIRVTDEVARMLAEIERYLPTDEPSPEPAP